MFERWEFGLGRRAGASGDESMPVVGGTFEEEELVEKISLGLRAADGCQAMHEGIERALALLKN